MGERIEISQKKSAIQTGLFIYLIYICFFWICDVFDLGCFFIGLSQGTILSRMISGILIVTIVFLLRNHIKLIRIKKDAFFYLAAAFIVAFGIFKSICPDTSTDVIKYHLLTQGPGFIDSFSDNLAPGGFQMLGFLLADRLFQPFRMILGYRAGTLFNTVLMLLIYSQVTGMLAALCKNQRKLVALNSKRISGRILSLFCRESVLAFFAIFCYDVVMQTASYMVELVSIPLALGALWFLIKKDIDTKEILLFALLNGLLFVMKLTNIVYIIPMVLLFIIKNFRKIRPWIWCSCILLCAVPVSIYLLFNFSTTGNPVFPYYNSIFKSIYFSLSNFKDLRWGPQTLLETLVWPLYMLFNPTYRQSEIVNYWPYVLGIGIIFVILFIVRALRRKAKEPVLRNERFLMSITLFISFYLWAFSTGHNRYFMLGMIICGIMGAMLIFDMTSYFVTAKDKRLTRALSAAATVAVSAVLVVQSLFSFKSTFNGTEWSWREYNTAVYKENLKYWLKDQNLISDENIPEVDMFLFAKGCNGSLAQQINPDANIVLYTYIYDYISDDSERDRYIDMVDQYLEDSSRTVADLFFYRDLQATIEAAGEYNLRIKKIYTLDSAFVLADTIIIAEYEKDTEEKGNTTISLPDDEYTVKINASHQSEVVFTAIAGLSDYRGSFEDTNFYFTVEAQDGESTVVLYEQAIYEGDFINVNTTLDLSQFAGEVTLTFSFRDSEHEIVSLEDLGHYRMLVINPQFEY